MPNITLRSQVGADGQLHLNIPTALTNTELDVIIFLRPVIPFNTKNQPKTFSERWRGKFKTVTCPDNHQERDLRFEYLAERYQL